MHNRKNIHIDDQPKKTCSSVLFSFLSKINLKSWLVLALLATSNQYLAQAAAEPVAPVQPQAEDEKSSVSSVVYMRGQGSGKFFATAADTVFPSAHCKLTIKKSDAPTEQSSFVVQQDCNIQARPVAQEAADGVYVGDSFEKGVIKRTGAGRNGAPIQSNLDFKRGMDVVTEERTVTDYSTGTSTSSTALYLTSKFGHFTATGSDVVRPATGCLLIVQPTQSDMQAHSSFNVEMACDGMQHREVSQTNHLDKFTANELNYGMIKRTLDEQRESELDFTKGAGVVVETVTRKPKA
jgi:hypothetical protein